MGNVINIVTKNYLVFLLICLIVIVLLIFLAYRIYLNIHGQFGEGNVIRRIKRLYKKYDYPYIKEIVLPINKDTFVYYDSIIFGDKFVYIVEIKNHKGPLYIDSLEDWRYTDRNNKEFMFTNAFYELELKKHILNRFLGVDKQRIVEVVIYNTETKPTGKKGNNYLIKEAQIHSFIKHFEDKEGISKFSIETIEDKGNLILETNVKNKKTRKKVINELKNGHFKK